jgi:hypothetical protein
MRRKLGKGRVERHRVLFSQGGVGAVPRNAHDHRIVIVGKAQDLAHRIGVAEQLPRHVLVQNHHAGRARTVRIEERAALQNGNRHDPEVVRSHGVAIVLDAHRAAARVRP